MKIAYYEKLGRAADVLKISEVEKPKPGPNEVLVRIYFSGLNPTDIKARTGFSAGMPFPRIIPHQDGAGVIEEVGENVSKTRLGERVWLYESQYGRANGTAAEYVAVQSKNAAILPDNVSFEIGASLGIPALTAYRCLFADGDLNGGKVLVHGGAGVVGNAAILLAKSAGAWVAATVLNDKQAKQAKKAGADLVMHRFNDDVSKIIEIHTKSNGVDRIVDVSLISNLDLNISCLSQGGVISAYATPDADSVVAVPLLKAMVHGCVFRFVYIYNVPENEKLKSVVEVNKLLSLGLYNPIIGKKYKLTEIIEAHEALESGEIIGKILLEI
jgi:NADPH2:quinone reductase